MGTLHWSLKSIHIGIMSGESSYNLLVEYKSDEKGKGY